MPVSNFWHLPVVLHFGTATRPKSILDVGIGTGTYGYMFRQFLDVAAERVQKQQWQTRIEGIEIFEPYRNPVWEYAYDKIHIGRIEEIAPSLGHYDLIVCADVIEHFSKSDALVLMDTLADHGGVVVYTTPTKEYPQGAWGGNEAETHLCTLAAGDFPHLVTSVSVGITTCYVCSKNPALLPALKLAASNCPRIKHKILPAVVQLIPRALRKLRRALNPAKGT